MIGAIKGNAQRFSHNTLLIFAGGVGYRVYANTKLIEKIKPEEEVRIFIHTHVKEDIFDLYGFYSREELSLFELLIEVSGVGPKTALSLLEQGVSEIKEAIVSSDVDFFLGIPRIGKKNAQRIIIDLKSKIGSLVELDLTGEESGKTHDVIEALTSMGFKKFEVQEVLRKLPKEVETTEDRIREALKRLGGR
jgi:Holliday junction DNA helicase RuvA